tara:strand:+ start:297 stop:998 length:702 start_codon:yes stop_codon:yes gene_type:complete
MNDYASLIKLQAIDLLLDKQASLMEGVLKGLSDSTAIDQLSAKRLAVEKELSKLAQSQSKLQLELVEYKDKISSLTKRMYAGTLRNEKEIKSLQDEITYLEILYTEKEESILDLMVKTESYDSMILSVDEKLKTAKDENQERQKDLMASKHDIEILISEQQIERDEVVKNITKTLLDSYTQLRIKKGGIAVSQLSRDMCGICRIVIPSSELQQMKRSREWRKCSGCDRMIVVG